MKADIYILMRLRIDSHDKTPKEAVIEELASCQPLLGAGRSVMEISSQYLSINDVEIIEVGSSLQEIRK